VISRLVVAVLVVFGACWLCALLAAAVSWLLAEDTEENSEHDKGDTCAKN